MAATEAREATEATTALYRSQAWGAVHFVLPDMLAEALTFMSRDDVNDMKHHFGHGPLHVAVKTSAECTALLLEAGAEVHVADKNGLTPLHLVACLDFVQNKNALTVLGLVLEAAKNLDEGARIAFVNAVDNAGETALHNVCAHSQSIVAIAMLLEAGADPSASVGGAMPSLASGKALVDVIRMIKEADGS